MQRFCGDRIFNHIDKMVTEGGKKLLEFGQKSDISEVMRPQGIRDEQKKRIGPKCSGLAERR